MQIIPSARKAQLEFFEARIDEWLAHAQELGLDSREVELLEDEIESARSALGHLLEQQSAAKAATSAYYNAIAAMNKRGREFVKRIKLEAETTGDPDIYGLGGLPLPKTPQQRKATPAPCNIKAVVNPQGTIDLTWDVPSRGAFAGKTVYIIERLLRAGTSGPPLQDWTMYDISHDRSYTDTRVPNGLTEIGYRVHTNRNGFVSNTSNTALISFGTVKMEMPAKAVAKRAA